MNEFQKIKKKFHKEAVLKGALCGFSLGLLTVGVLWIIFKRTGMAFAPWLYIVVGVVVALASGGITYLILRPRDKKLAKRLDERFGFDEKVQTMVEFVDESGEMVELQRADTEARLRELPKQKLKIRHILEFILLLILSAAVFVTAVFIPAKEEPKAEGPTDNAYEMDEYDRLSLRQLIEYVKNSDLEEPAKTEVVSELENLLAVLDDTEWESEMKAHVIGAIQRIDLIVENVNSYKEICLAMNESTNSEVKALAVAVSELEEEVFQLAIDGTTGEEAKEGIRAQFNLTEAALNPYLLTVADEIKTALKDSGIADTDALYKAWNAFAVALEEVAQHTGLTDEQYQSELDSLAFAPLKASVPVALAKQAVNNEVRAYVIDALKEIFGITDAEMPRLSGDKVPGMNGGGESDKEQDGIHSGGLGSGNTVYGSDDMIYDPDYEVSEGVFGGHISYGEVLDAYNAIIMGMIADGTLSEEMEEMLSDYLDALYSGKQNEENKQDGNE